MNISNKSVLITGAKPWVSAGPFSMRRFDAEQKKYMRERAVLYNMLMNA